MADPAWFLPAVIVPVTEPEAPFELVLTVPASVSQEYLAFVSSVTAPGGVPALPPARE